MGEKISIERERKKERERGGQDVRRVDNRKCTNKWKGEEETTEQECKN